MNDSDTLTCRHVVTALTSDKYKDKNFLFIAPFDLSQTPGYLDVVPKLMDLETLASNLEAGVYSDRDAFFADCFLIFENAITYHGKRKDTKWIAKFAKEMLKITQRERKNAEKPEGAPKPRQSGLLLPTKKNTVEGGAPTKLKLKLGGGITGASDPSESVKLKMSIKLKGPSQGKTPPAAAAAALEQNELTAPEAKKPRLTLKLGMGKGKDTDETTSETPKGSKVLVKSTAPGGSQGKELPKGVIPPMKPEARNPSKSTVKITATKSSAGTTKIKASTSKTSKAKPKTLKLQASTNSKGASLFNPMRKAQAAKVLNGLKRRENKNIGWFLQPVSDKNIVQDYRAKIPNPMDLSTIHTKLNEKNEYTTLADFVLDLRRIFSNCLRYNTSIKDSLRPVAVQGLETTETLLAVFLGKPDPASPSYPPLLFCWKLCMNVLDTLYNLTNPNDGNMTAYYFLYPVSFYCGGQFPPDYKQKIPKPMDYGTVTSNLIEGRYSTLAEFETDCKLVLENCITYYGGQPDGKNFTDQAKRLMTVLQQQLDALSRYVKSPSGQAAQRQAQIVTPIISKPQIHFLLGIVEEMKALQYTDKLTKITESAMGPFEKAVSLTAFPDYVQYVQLPMDLSTVERKVKSASYATPEDFEYDVLLIFQNCITYYSARQADHLVAMAKFGMKSFKKILLAKMKPFDDPVDVETVVLETATRKDPPPTVPQAATGKIKVAAGPRITLSASATAAAAAARPKTPTPRSSVPKSKPGQPVPLHIAIAQVKEQFPLRRAVKTLQDWEAACARFFKEMMRHPWISAARPKFIYHVPVPVIFPELREAYAGKIKQPMDLTTVECALLAGNKYTAPEDFVNDLALVFSNAIVFNKDGKDIGDPLSCAYYDASIHLLRYCRWLSLELLSEYVDGREHMDVPEDPTLPLTAWKLTLGNHKKAREEMEAIVMNEPIERSLEGDRFTWTETECEKLLKALRLQSDLKYMTFFIQPNYPADYTAFITKPMDWEHVQRNLRKRVYEKFLEVVDDLRLIFSNALKYNARHAGTDSVSGRAFDSAKYMSHKLEVAINKMMIAVSDRLERERIDHENADRETAAAERAEEERIRAQWKSDNPGKEGGPTPVPRVEPTQQRIRTLTKRAAAYRREQANFEVPFFDEEDDGQHETSYLSVVRQQKAIFERQRQERTKMQHATSSVAAGLFMRLVQQDLALQWVHDERKKLGIPSPAKPKQAESPIVEQTKKSTLPTAPSQILKTLDAKDRKPFQLKIPERKRTRQAKKSKTTFNVFGDDSIE